MREDKRCPDCNSPLTFLHTSNSYSSVYKCYNENCKSVWVKRMNKPKSKTPVKELDSRPLTEVIKT